MAFMCKREIPPLGRLLPPALGVLFMLLLGVLPVAAQTDITGVWTLNVPTGDGNTIKMFLDLKQSADQVSGAAWYDFNKRPIREGSFGDGKLHLSFVVWADDPPALGAADGTIQGDKLRLTIHLPGDVVGTGLAERSTAEALALPPRLPIPELHDVPDNGLARTPPMGWNSWNKFAAED